MKNRADRDLTAVDILGRYERWPRRMWANEEVASFLGWLQEHNERSGANVGFYGLDVYSLWEPMHAVIDYLSQAHPEALDTAKAAYSCFEPFGEDPQSYAHATRLVPTSCEQEVVALLADMRRRAADEAEHDDEDPEAGLDARQNAEVMVGAERYYRAMIGADAQSWNVRDHHMTDRFHTFGPNRPAAVHGAHAADGGKEASRRSWSFTYSFRPGAGLRGCAVSMSRNGPTRRSCWAGCRKGLSRLTVYRLRRPTLLRVT